MAVDARSFQEEVLDASHQLPIVADFWAAWCGPCKVLGPVLEGLEGESKGRWRLVKVDVDQHQAAAARYRVSGIPAVMLFADGQVVSSFTGALPEAQVRQWLEGALPTSAAKALDEAEAVFRQGDRARARTILEAEGESGLEIEGRILLAALIYEEDSDQALALAADADEANRLWDMASAVRLLHDLERRDLKPESDAEKRYAEGIQALRDRRYEAALEAWIEVIGSPGGREVDDDGARRACIALFQVLGEAHPATSACRRPFSSALY